MAIDGELSLDMQITALSNINKTYNQTMITAAINTKTER
jgi:hypothetical protein